MNEPTSSSITEEYLDSFLNETVQPSQALRLSSGDSDTEIDAQGTITVSQAVKLLAVTVILACLTACSRHEQTADDICHDCDQTHRATSSLHK